MRMSYAPILLSLSLVCMMGISGAQYWFQTGALGTYNASHNSGASVNIETVYQNTSSGSFGFWVGESLSNGAFAQVGYEVENVSGYYPTDCSMTGCNGSVYISAGVPTWFWEYFPQNYSGGSFLGGIGTNDSAGPQGSFSTYAMNSSGDVWNFYFDGQEIGSVDLGASGSGANPPTAIGELAATDTNTEYMNPVEFKNLEYYFGGRFIQVPVAYSTISYGRGSESFLGNLYGIEEVGSYTNFFRLGSGVPLNNQTKLWSLGYALRVVSDYGNISSENNYSGSSTAYISAPDYVYINSTVREKFTGWKGYGDGAYSGSNNSTGVLMIGNITETAQWQRQYYVNVSSRYGTGSGGGWYDSGALLSIMEYPKTLAVGEGVREVFEGWSSNEVSVNGTAAVSVTMPLTISAIWDKQYLVNVTSPHGSVSGNGWYGSGSPAVISISNYTEYTSNSSRVSFIKWSNGSTEANFTAIINSPILLAAVFGTQYRVNFNPKDAYGNPISAEYVDLSGADVPLHDAFISPGSYEIDHIRYKGTNVTVDKNITVDGPYAVSFDVQVYNVNVSATNELGQKVNASAMLMFENGTKFDGYLGNDGAVSFTDVPYGYLNGYLYYKSLKHQVSAGYGSDISTTFINPVTFAPVIGITLVLIAVAVHTYMGKKLRRLK